MKVIHFYKVFFLIKLWKSHSLLNAFKRYVVLELGWTIEIYSNHTFILLLRKQMHWYWATFNSVQISCSVMSNSLWLHGLQHDRLPCPSPTPGACSNSSPSSWWCHPTISSSVVPLSLAFNHSQHQGHFQWVSSSHQVAKVLEFQLQHQSSQ